MFHGDALELLGQYPLTRIKGGVQLILTSPPFVLNRKKRYGNLRGEEYIAWLAGFATLFRECLADDGSVVVELGNAWEPGSPTMTTVAMEALLAFREAGNFHLCQEFIWYNPARLPTPAQWVAVERIRVKDAFTRIWWLSGSRRPKADNRRVLQAYSSSMLGLLRRGRYNPGRRPSEHVIGKTSFLTNNAGSIPANVLRFANTSSRDEYQKFCRNRGLTPHPARMPRQMAEFFIRFLTAENDLVLDPFAGSNTTGAVAEQLGRRWVAIELALKYADSSHSRFARRTT